MPLNWRRLKVFAIVALLFLNIVFIAMVLDRNHSATHYDDDVTRDALLLFARDGLDVDARFLTGKLPSPQVLSGDMNEGKRALSKKLMGKGYLAQEAVGGTRYFGLYDEIYLGNDFSFTYSYVYGEEMPSYLLIEGNYMDVTGERYAEGAWSSVQTFLTEKALLPQATDKYASEITCEAILLEKDHYIVRALQKIEGSYIAAETLFLVRDGIVRSAEGTLVTYLPTQTLEAENVGLLEIFFSEKEALRGNKKKTVSDVVYSYAPYFDANGSFYLVPLCSVIYEDGSRSTYNFVSGEIWVDA